MEKKDLDIRYSMWEDEAFLLKNLENERINQWFPMSGKEEIKESVRNWMNFVRFRSSLTAIMNGQPCGMGTLFLMPYKKVAHQAMFYMFIAEKFQKQGIGTSLLKNMLNLAKNYFRLEMLVCEVFEGCPIFSLLEKFHFTSFAYQEKYVKINEKYLARNMLEYFL